MECKELSSGKADGSTAVPREGTTLVGEDGKRVHSICDEHSLECIGLEKIEILYPSLLIITVSLCFSSEFS